MRSAGKIISGQVNFLSRISYEVNLVNLDLLKEDVSLLVLHGLVVGWMDDVSVVHGLVVGWMDDVSLVHSLVVGWIDDVSLVHGLVVRWMDYVSLVHGLVDLAVAWMGA